MVASIWLHWYSMPRLQKAPGLIPSVTKTRSDTLLLLGFQHSRETEARESEIQGQTQTQKHLKRKD